MLEENQEFPEVPIYWVCDNLQHINNFKGPGPNGLSNWVLKEYAEFLVQPVSDILNASCKEQKLPSSMEACQCYSPPKSQATVRPQERTLSNFPEPCSLKHCWGLHCTVFDYIKPALEEKVAPNQFGTIAGSSTVMAHKHGVEMTWSDWQQWISCSTVSLWLQKGTWSFCLSHPGQQKLQQLNISNSVINWVSDFLWS